MNSFEFFVNYIFPPLILIVGLIGNLIALSVLTRAKLKKIGTRYTYIILFITDTIYLFQIVINYLGYGFSLDLTTLSSHACKLYIYFNYSLGALSPWLLNYISMEKFISIKFPNRRLILKNKVVQISYFICILVFNLVFYVPVPFLYDVIDYNEGKNKTAAYGCDFTDHIGQKVASFMDLINRSALPIFIMVFLSFYLIYFIYTSRKRVMSDYTYKENKIFSRNVKFSITSVYFNIIYVMLNLPLLIDLFLPNYYESIAFLFTFYLYYMSYGLNFYVILATNKFFRQQLMLSLKIFKQI